MTAQKWVWCMLAISILGSLAITASSAKKLTPELIRSDVAEFQSVNWEAREAAFNDLIETACPQPCNYDLRVEDAITYLLRAFRSDRELLTQG